MQYVGVVYSTGKYVTCRSKQHENHVSNIQMNCLQLFISFQFTLCLKTLPSRCCSVNRNFCKCEPGFTYDPVKFSNSQIWKNFKQNMKDKRTEKGGKKERSALNLVN